MREAPFDNLTLKIHYPARFGGTFEERDSGFIPPDGARAPFPVAVILPGVNISGESYGWIAKELAKAGFAAATYTWATVEIGGRINLSPGIALDALRRGRYGEAPCCPALPAILGELERANRDGPLAGHLDTVNHGLLPHFPPSTGCDALYLERQGPIGRASPRDETRI